MEYNVEKITPATAKEYLRANTKNPRGTKLNMARVKQYAHDMANGLWELNGEAIVFDKRGVLKNGAHRLAAIMTANVPVEIVVIRGVDESVTAYDMPYLRTVSQMANAEDIDVQKEMLCAVKILYNLLPEHVPTHMEIKQYAKAHENELNRAYRTLLNGEYTRYNKRATCGLASYLMLQTQQMPFYEVELFFRVFSSGDSCGTDGYEVSPALIARKIFQDRWTGKSNPRTQKEQLDILVQALMAFHESKERKTNYKISQPFAYEPLLKKIGGEC